MNSQHSIMLHRIEDSLSQETIETLARKSGFLKRTRKLTAHVFLHACCLMAISPNGSLRNWAIVIGGLIRDTISKQAIAKRLQHSAIRFLRQTLFAAVKTTSRLQPLIDSGAFQHFQRVLLEDSTSFRLPKRLASIFPGSGNQHQTTTATLKIQTTYDALSERFVHFFLTPFTRTDQAAAADILSLARSGDLILRDLGYFVLQVFALLNSRGIFFLSRYKHSTALFESDGRPLNLLKTLRQTGSLDQQVLLGSKLKIPVRLIAVRVPLRVARARRRKLKQDRNRHVNPSAEHLALLEWEIFITNVPPSIWTTKTVIAVYGVRWRLEIVFKTWKQHFHLTQVTNVSHTQLEVLIYARLLFITLFQVYVFRSWSLAVKQQTGKTLSLLKVTQFISQHIGLILFTLTQPDGVQQLEAQILKHCTYDRRTRLNYEDMLAVLT